ncbi:lysozyme inhibitor LprI family protein [Salinisphaera sp. P385]|uniref:Lysozyme inhibitor LprI family protein n=1 Tax=Spectribacter acetivorans TaxID=3075603 RepID=A0ABU3B4J7_9GAMM|nr:lysozyme inhibitor LprI family protein [Salinisphaera sp. P385]MDT0617040.1 lysozyme inhibitor LprI family protein [Salinisphaera sp. P385]
MTTDTMLPLKHVAMLLVTLALLVPSSAMAADRLASAPTTQLGMNQETCEDASAAASRLQAEYDALLSRHADDPEVQARIREAREAYEQFRQAHLAAYSAAAEGSVAPMCRCLTATALAEAQQGMVAASPEGDVCGW